MNKNRIAKRDFMLFNTKKIKFQNIVFIAYMKNEIIKK